MRETFRFDTASFETLSCFISSHHAEHAIGYCHFICEHYSSNTSFSVSSPLLNSATSETLAHSVSPRHPLSLSFLLFSLHITGAWSPPSGHWISVMSHPIHLHQLDHPSLSSLSSVCSISCGAVRRIYQINRRLLATTRQQILTSNPQFCSPDLN